MSPNSQLDPSQRAELRAATERFGAQALELARLERLKLTQQRSGKLQPLRAGNRQQLAEAPDLSRATSAPHMLYNQMPTSAHSPPMSRGASSGFFPQSIQDAWQRGVVIPGMPPPPVPISPEKLREIEERRRAKAKRMVEEWRQTQLQIGAQWVERTRWYGAGDTPPAWFRRRAAQGPGYAPKAHRLSSPRLSAMSASAGSLPRSPPRQRLEAEEDDDAGEGDEDFETGMRQNAMERDAADNDGDGKLDFDEFCSFVRNREEGEFTDAELKTRFKALDEDGSGQVDMSEYVQWSLKDALARSAQRVVDLFRAWDEDRSGSVDKKEFRKAIRAMGYDVAAKDADAVFDSLDEDRSGSLEYKELNIMLRKGQGSQASLTNLKRMAHKQKQKGVDAKLTNKNLNANYVAQRTAALPSMVKLSARTGISVQEQLATILKEHQVRLIDLFREWDDDGNGALDKYEMRQAIAALGYDAPKHAIDALFDSIDDDRSGWIEFHELKAALSETGAKRATKALQTYSGRRPGRDAGVAESDVGGEGEEDFKAGMRQNAMERDAADRDGDGKLDFAEFVEFVKDREEGKFTEAELQERFNKLDEDGSGLIDMAEYLQWSLKDALLRSSSRVVDLFRAWDEDRSGSVDKKEFHKAVRALGFDVEKQHSDSVFDSLDDDKSGELEYKELNVMLRRGAGSEGTKANLKRMQSKQRDMSRGAKVTRKNLDSNYVGSRVSALPPMVKLSARSGQSIQEQLATILKEHQVRLIDLFREWDDDGNGALDKKEMRTAIAALGYDAPKFAIDAFFDSIDDDGNGWIEFHELKAALSDKGIKNLKREEALKAHRALRKGGNVDGDAAGAGEEGFEAGMRQNAMERDAADGDGDGKLDFEEFCIFVQEREESKLSKAELKERFTALDEDNSGLIDTKEYLMWSLKDALARSSQRVVDLFRTWDEDRSGTIDKKEFFKAVKSLGFEVTQPDTDAVFDALDEDKSGELEYKELNVMLRQGVGSEATKANLKRMAKKQRDTSRTAKLTAKNVNQNYVAQRASALPPMVKLSNRGSELSVPEQLCEILKNHSVRLIDLFREWDDDGNGALDKKEFRAAIAALGYDAPKTSIDALFDSIDDDRNGWIEFHELKAALSERGIAKAKKRDRAARKSDDDEDLGTGMRQNAMERDAADADGDGKLNFKEFCSFVRDREEGEFTDAELKARFKALDEDGSGQVDMHEYLQWSLKDALLRSSQRVVDLFRAWDEDRSGTVDKKEFHKAVSSLGFTVTAKDTDAVFDALDADRSGELEYKELNDLLRRGLGADATAAKLKRHAHKQRDTSRMAKVTRKNLDSNYVGARVSALPPMVKLDATSEKSIPEQLYDILKEHSVRLIDLFREWDDDGNGALDKKEMRQAIAALGYSAPKKQIDAFFESIDDDNNGWIEFEELKEALKEKNVKRATKAQLDQRRQEEAALPAAEGDVAGAGEEDFESGMRQNAMERDAADADQDGKLDFTEFCQFVRDREIGEFTDEELKKRFDALDEDGSGQVDMSEYLQWSLKDVLQRSSARVCDLFRMWDEDKSGTIDKKEFGKAVRSLGFEVDQAATDAVFDSLDEDKSGALEYKELNEMLRKSLGANASKAKLKRMQSKQADRSRGAKVTRKNLDSNYVGARVSALPPTVQLDASSDKSIAEQIFDALKSHSAKLIDLFREWDDDGNGAVDKKEMRRGIAALGYEAPRKEIDAFFESIDDDDNGFIEFEELKDALKEKNVKMATKALQDKRRKEGVGSNVEAAEGDVVGTGEEDFEAGMRQNAMERDAADGDGDGKLDFEEFCVFVREREEGDFSDAELKERFGKLDEDGSGKIDMAEYLHFSLKDALMRSCSRVVDLFRAWDEDASGTVDKKEFHKAVRSLGFAIEQEHTDAVFDTLDVDGSGALEYKELNEMLRKGVGADGTKSNLKRMQGKQADRSRMAKVTRKNLDSNYVSARVSALPPMVKLDASAGSIQEQLTQLLQDHSVKLIDLFREWDDDGNGALDKKEMRQAIAALGYDAPKKEIDAFFESIDDDNNGWIEFAELKEALKVRKNLKKL